MLLRPLNFKTDLAQTMVGIRDFVERLDYREFLPDSDDELAAALARLIDLGCVDVVVAEHEDWLVGGVGLLYAPHVWNKDVKVMEELFLWTSGSAPRTTALRLIRFALERGRERGCSLALFKKLTSSPDSLSALYERMGLRLVETSYMGPLQTWR